jgi:toxin HigB-1
MKIMEIRLACGEMAALCNSSDEMRRRLGKFRAERLKQRLSELRAAETLEQFGCLPGPACHELNGRRTGQLAARLDDSWLLILEPDGDKVPTKRGRSKQGRRLNWTEITSVVILEVVNEP